MTLREKLKPSTSINTQGEAIRFANECYEIAEEFAIGFAEWYLKKSEKYDSYLKLKNDTKELLEIYKNESNTKI